MGTRMGMEMVMDTLDRDGDRMDGMVDSLDWSYSGCKYVQG